MSLEDMKDPANEGVTVRAFSNASGSVASSTDEELMRSVPNAMDPAVIAVAKGHEKGLTASKVVRMPALFAAGDKVYHKKQKVEATYAGEAKGHTGMALVKVGGKTFRVKKDHLVKL